MDEDGASVAFTRADDVDRAVSVDVGENRVLGRLDLADGNCWPRERDAARTRVQINPDVPTFLPRGRNVIQSVAVDVVKANSIGSAGRRIDDVTNPGLSPNAGRNPDESDEEVERSHC